MHQRRRTQLHNDYTYTEANIAAAAITSPAPGSTLTSASTTFTWNAGTWRTAYYLWVGTTPGGYDLANMGPFTGTSATVNLPTNGATIYVRLWTLINGTPAPQRLHLHRGQHRRGRDHQPVAWQHVDLGFDHLHLERRDGRNRLLSLGRHHSRRLQPGQHRPFTGTSATVNLPTNGTTIYVRLWTCSTVPRFHNDYTYTEAP